MTPEIEKDHELNNEDAYDDLVGAIEASNGILSLLIAVCDDSNFREQIISRYEAELQSQMRCYRLPIIRGEPSLKRTIAQAVERNEYLEQRGRAVFTVTGAEQLFFLKLGQERSEQEIFFGYLQWTREGLREFRYPIVLWVTNRLLGLLIKKAPDFWSWRKGVFHFASSKAVIVPKSEMALLRSTLTDLGVADIDEEVVLSLEDLQALIQQTEQQRGTQDPLLASLYLRMGIIYGRRLEHGEAQSYEAEQASAIEWFRKSAELQKDLGLEEDFATSLIWLAHLYQFQRRYSEAESLYLQALELRKHLLGDEHLDVASSLNFLASLYKFQRRYSEAEPLLLQALELRKRLLGEEHPDVAHIFNNLALVYKLQGHYNEAESLYLQALQLLQRLLGEEHSDTASNLNNLALLYKAQGRYSEAEPLLLQVLELRKRLLGEAHRDVASSLSNLASLYHSQRDYSEAELLSVQALAIAEQCLGDNHPNTITIRENLEILRQAIASQPQTSTSESQD
jgi:tetratricopeptide (TPR) repeat protein